MPRCEQCGRTLQDPVSVARGIGPECLQAVRESPSTRYKLSELARNGDCVALAYKARLDAGKGLTPSQRATVERRWADRALSSHSESSPQEAT